MDMRQVLTMIPNRGAIEEWARHGAQSQYVGTMGSVRGTMPLVLCRVLNKYLMLVNAEDASVAPHLMLSGIWETWITMAIADHVKPGMCCVDVGSHLGYYTMLMADLAGESGHVLSVDPQDWACQCQHRSLDLNGFRSRVHIEPVAAGAENGEGSLYAHPYLTGDASLEQRAHLGKCEDVTIETLDLLLERWGHAPDFVKIDAERLEWQVLEGMSRTIAEKRPLTICVEVTGPAVPHIGRYEDLGFEVGTVGYDGTVRIFEPSRDEREGEDWQMLWLRRK